MTDYTVAVLEDAIEILDILRDAPESLSLAEVTHASRFVKNKVFRILHTLEKHEMVEKDDAGRFRLGLRCLEYGHRVERETDLLRASKSVMDRLASETNESIFLGVVSGADALCVAARVSPQIIRLYAEVGRRARLHSGGVPKTLLAYLPSEQQQLLLDQFYAQPNRYLIVTRAELEAALAKIRGQGYTMIVNELDDGAHSIAAPIRNHDGKVIAAVSIAGPSHRFHEERIRHYIALIQDAAAQISRALGYYEPAPVLL